MKKKTKRIHFTYLVAGLAILSLGATYATRSLLEIGPVATITGAFPELQFIDNSAGDPDWEIEAFSNRFFEIAPLGAGNGSGQFKIHADSDADQMTLDANGNVAINGELAQVFNELEIYGNTGSADPFAMVALTPGGQGSSPSTRLRIDTPTNRGAIEVRGASGGYSNPFNISLDAPNNALSIDSTGDVGIGVSTTGVRSGINLHVTGGQVLLDHGSSEWMLNPGGTGLWFNQDGNIGVVQFNNNAPTNSLVVEGTSGDIGIGTSAPNSSLHIIRSNASAQFTIEENNQTAVIRQMMNILNNGGIQFSMENTALAKRWDFTNNTIGDFNISLVGTGGPELRLTGAGNLFIRGTLTESSDRDQKENYQEVDCNEVLQKVADLPVTTWNYIDDDDSVRHMGPVAQDFRGAFGLGHNDTTITTTDKAGVALVAIKALNNKLDEKDATINELQTELDEIHDRMARLEAAVNMLTEQ